MNLKRKENVVKKTYEIACVTPDGEHFTMRFVEESEEKARLDCLCLLPEAQNIEVKECKNIEWHQIQKRKKS